MIDKKPTCQLSAGRSDQNIVVRVDGWATMPHSLTVRLFAQCMLDASDAELYIDLDKCAYMDSTFTGTLAAISIDRQDKLKKKLKLLFPSRSLRLIFEQLGLDKVVDLIDGPLRLPDTFLPLPKGGLSEIESIGQHIVDTHKALIALGGPNVEEYRKVVNDLNQEITRREKE